MASSDDILEQLDDAREHLKLEIMKEVFAKRAISLGAVFLVAACVLGPLHLIPEALAIAGGIASGVSLALGTGFSLYFLFGDDWRANYTDVNHKRYIKSIRRKITRLETSYNEAVSKEAGRGTASDAV